MATSARWRVKENEKKEYTRGKHRTDYNIPVFGFKSAILIFVVAMITFSFVPVLLQGIVRDVRLPAALISGFINGFVVAYTQFFIERKKGFVKAFYITFILVSLFVSLFLFLLYYSGAII